MEEERGLGWQRGRDNREAGREEGVWEERCVRWVEW